MTQREFLGWVEHFKAHPFDDLHRIHRPAALVASSLGGVDLQTRLDWLEPPASVGDFSAADLQTFKTFGVRVHPRKG